MPLDINDRVHSLELHFAREGLRGNTKWLIVLGPISGYLTNYAQLEQRYLSEEDAETQLRFCVLLSGGYNWRSQATPKLEVILQKLESFGAKIESVWAVVHSLSYVAHSAESKPDYLLIGDSLFELKPAQWDIFVQGEGGCEPREPLEVPDVADELEVLKLG